MRGHAILTRSSRPADACDIDHRTPDRTAPPAQKPSNAGAGTTTANADTSASGDKSAGSGLGVGFGIAGLIAGLIGLVLGGAAYRKASTPPPSS